MQINCRNTPSWSLVVMWGAVWLTRRMFMRVWSVEKWHSYWGFWGLCLVCVCVRVTGSVAEINWVSLSAVTGQPSLTADCMCVALCRLEKKLWTGAFGAGGASWAGGAAAVSPPRGHACCRGKCFSPHRHSHHLQMRTEFVTPLWNF